jgi:ABC-type lipoprotein export system ATPase subunit
MQRVAIGRALINEPKIILADEPTGNLDSATALKIFQLFQNLNTQGLTLIIVTHNLELAKSAHKTIQLKDGEMARKVPSHGLSKKARS